MVVGVEGGVHDDGKEEDEYGPGAGEAEAPAAAETSGLFLVVLIAWI